ITLTDGSGKGYRATTNTFGYFRLTDIPAGNVVLTASARGYTFGPRFIDASADVADLLIVARR
ncbi:MAG: carboxypeptidase-like regulatory domain-containing protein, partial [bacterium]|nr:carboxypeptidase-like regulatory domain-containing protein [bacterium]